MSCISVKDLLDICRRCRERGWRDLFCAAACLNIEAALLGEEIWITRERISQLIGFEISKEVYEQLVKFLDGKRVRPDTLMAMAASVVCYYAAVVTMEPD